MQQESRVGKGSDLNHHQRITKEGRKGAIVYVRLLVYDGDGIYFGISSRNIFVERALSSLLFGKHHL